MKRLFVYGTLKKGRYNHERFGMDHATFVRIATINGYSMYTNGIYPAAVKGKDSDSIVGEVYDVPDELYDRIERMETYAGYTVDELDDMRIFAMPVRHIDPAFWKKIPDGMFTGGQQ